MSPTRTLSLDAIHALARDALLANNFSTAQADAIARNVTAAERDGCVSHGLFRIPFYLRAARENADADAAATPRLHQSEGAFIHVDAAHGFCPLALEIGLPELITRARRFGIAALAIHRAYNIAALWPEVEQLAENNLIALAFTAANAYVAPAGGTEPVFGTNPMAFAFPRADQPPLVFDQASSASARGEILLHQREGRALPQGWAIDQDGRPTTDAASALAGAQLPFGGYKGSSLALMVELLAGPLIGENLSLESSAHDVNGVGAPFGGELLIAIDPLHAARPGSEADHLAHAEKLFSAITAQPGTRLPSSRRYRARAEHLRDGVSVAAATLDQISQDTGPLGCG